MTGLKHGNSICYSGYREEQDPRKGIFPSYEQVKEDLLLLADNWSFLRLYDCSKHAETVLSVIETEKLDFQGTISLGFNYIDTRTERIAKGFTFIENFSVGFSHQTFTNSFIYLGTNFGHVSNLNFQQPNNGYNILGLEIGYSYTLN